MKKITLSIIMLSFLFGCTPEVGSTKWCKNMKEKAKGDWTMTETKDYAKHCIF